MKISVFAVLALSVFVATPAFAKGKVICKSSVCTDIVAQVKSIEKTCKPYTAADEKVRDKLNAIYESVDAYQQTLTANHGDSKLVNKAFDSAYSKCGFGPSEDDIY